MTFRRTPLLTLLALALALPLVSGCLGGDAADAGTHAPAPDFALTTLEGENVTLADYRGRVLVIDMMATWCTPCKEAMPVFREYLAENPDAPVAILSVDVDPTETHGGADPLPGFMERYNATWPAAYDTDDVFTKYRAHGIPTLVIVGADGTLREKLQLARVTTEDLESALAPHIADAEAANGEPDAGPTSDTAGLLARNAVPLSGAFLAGVFAFFSPCGFPMLPAFVAYYLQQETRSAGGRRSDGTRGSWWRRGLTGLGGGTVAALGAFLVLGAVAALAVALGAPFKERVLLLELIGGLVVLVLGVLMLAGKDVSFTPRVVASERKGVVGLFTFGALYAAVGAGCVAPVFISVVFQAFAAPTTLEGALIMSAYGLGFGLLLVGVTVAVALAGAGLVRGLNRVLPHVKRAAGVVLVVVGLYLVWYWASIELFLT